MKRILGVGILWILCSVAQAQTFPTPQKNYLDTVGGGLSRSGNTVNLLLSNSTGNTWIEISAGVWQRVEANNPAVTVLNGGSTMGVQSNLNFTGGLAASNNVSANAVDIYASGFLLKGSDASNLTSYSKGMVFALTNGANLNTSTTIPLNMTWNGDHVFNGIVVFNSNVTNATVITTVTTINAGTNYLSTIVYSTNVQYVTVITNILTVSTTTNTTTIYIQNGGTLTINNAALVASNAANAIFLPGLTYTNGIWTWTNPPAGIGGSGGGDTNAFTGAYSSGATFSNGLLYVAGTPVFPTNVVIVSGGSVLNSNRTAYLTVVSGDGLTSNNVTGLIAPQSYTNASSALKSYVISNGVLTNATGYIHAAVSNQPSASAGWLTVYNGAGVPFVLQNPTLTSVGTATYASNAGSLGGNLAANFLTNNDTRGVTFNNSLTVTAAGGATLTVSNLVVQNLVSGTTTGSVSAVNGVQGNVTLAVGNGGSVSASGQTVTVNPGLVPSSVTASNVLGGHYEGSYTNGNGGSFTVSAGVLTAFAFNRVITNINITATGGTNFSFPNAPCNVAWSISMPLVTGVGVSRTWQIPSLDGVTNRAGIFVIQNSINSALIQWAGSIFIPNATNVLSFKLNLADNTQTLGSELTTGNQSYNNQARILLDSVPLKAP